MSAWADMDRLLFDTSQSLRGKAPWAPESREFIALHTDGSVGSFSHRPAHGCCSAFIDRADERDGPYSRPPLFAFASDAASNTTLCCSRPFYISVRRGCSCLQTARAVE